VKGYTLLVFNISLTPV